MEKFLKKKTTHQNIHNIKNWKESCHQLSSVVQPCLTLCALTHCSTPGFPVHHQLPVLTQTHVHRVGDAVQPSHPLSSPSPPSFHQFNFPASGSVPMSQFFSSGGQSIGAVIWSSNSTPGHKFWQNYNLKIYMPTSSLHVNTTNIYKSQDMETT